jgi:hypothetical protein
MHTYIYVLELQAKDGPIKQKKPSPGMENRCKYIEYADMDSWLVLVQQQSIAKKKSTRTAQVQV